MTPHGPSDNAVAIELDDVNKGLLFGDNDALLIDIEQLFPIRALVKGNTLRLDGPLEAVDGAKRVITQEILRSSRGKQYQGFESLQRRAVEDLSREPVTFQSADLQSVTEPQPYLSSTQIAESLKFHQEKEVLVTRKGTSIRAKTPGQQQYLDAIENFSVVFGIGPAGTGKTYLAMAKAVQALLRKEVSKLILTRPAVEAGERLGFLPGTLSEKIDPYLRPLFDALSEMLEPETVQKLMDLGTIEVAPLAYMRGRTLNDAFIILDEAQNTTPEQLKMFLTRLGFGSKMVITGDVTQIDLPGGTSGLLESQRILKDVEDVAFRRLGAEDVVRHRLVAEIIEAYENYRPEQR